MWQNRKPNCKSIFPYLFIYYKSIFHYMESYCTIEAIFQHINLYCPMKTICCDMKSYWLNMNHMSIIGSILPKKKHVLTYKTIPCIIKPTYCIALCNVSNMITYGIILQHIYHLKVHRFILLNINHLLT